MSAAAVINNGKLDSLLRRVESLDSRMERLEAGLNALLTRFQIPVPGAVTTEVEAVEVKSEPYTYHSLDAAKNEIRVLGLYNSIRDEDPIVLDIITLGLDEKSVAGARKVGARILASFITLSYTWGTNKREGSVILDGHLFPVTKNLETALRYMRKFKRPARLASGVAATAFKSFWWADALCINQDDIAERNQQVSLMTRIYKLSFGVQVVCDLTP